MSYVGVRFVLGQLYLPELKNSSIHHRPFLLYRPQAVGFGNRYHTMPSSVCTVWTFMSAPFPLLIPSFRFREPKTIFHCDGHFLIIDSTQILCILLLNLVVSMSLSRCNGEPSPQCIQLFLNISVNRVRVEGPSIGRVGVPIRKFGVDSDAGRLYAAVGSILAVYEEMQAYHPGDVDRGLYIYVQGRNIEL